MDEAQSEKLTAQAEGLAKLLLADVSDTMSGNEAMTVATVALGHLIFVLVTREGHEFVLARVQKVLRSQLEFAVRFAAQGPASDAPAGHA